MTKFLSTILLNILLICQLAGCSDTLQKTESQPPRMVENLHFEIENGNIVLNWDNSAGATKYNFYWTTDKNQPIRERQKISNVTSPLEFPIPSINSVYYATITAENPAGESESPDDLLIAIPPNIYGNSGNNKNIINWDVNEQYDFNYVLHWSNSESISKENSSIYLDVTPPFSHENLAADSNYHYFVTLVAAGVESPPSNIITLNPSADNNPPIINTDILEIEENAIDAGTISASDPDNHQVEFAIGGGFDADKFIIDNITGNLRFKNPPDYENPQDTNTDNIYEIEITVSDLLIETPVSKSIYVEVLDVPEPIKWGTNLHMSEGDFYPSIFMEYTTDKFLVAGQNPQNNAVLLFYDKEGTLLLSNEYTITDFAKTHFIAALLTDTNGLIVAGYADVGSGRLRPLIVKFNNDHSIAWSKLLTAAIFDLDRGLLVETDSATFSYISEFSNGDILLGGDFETLNANNAAWLVRLSSNGDILWQNAYNSSANSYIRGMQILENNNIVIISRSDSDSANILSFLNGNGTIIRQKATSSAVNQFDSLFTYDGDIFLTGIAETVTTGWMSRISFDGSVAWEFLYPNTEYAYNFLPYKNRFIGSYLHGGLLVIESTGKVFYSRTYSDIEFRISQITNKNGILLRGTRQPNGSHTSHTILIQATDATEIDFGALLASPSESDISAIQYHSTWSDYSGGSTPTNATISDVDVNISEEFWFGEKDIYAGLDPNVNAPFNLSATQPTIGNRTVELNWEQDLFDYRGLIVYRELNGTLKRIATLRFTATQYFDNDVRLNRTYTYYIKSYSLNGYSEYSDSAVIDVK